jgi:tRNA threonylcarbamoyladenosine biosynthesis protein TsaE
MKEYFAKTTEDLPNIAKDIIENFKNDRIFAFYGKMGSGKTSLIKEICRYKEVKDKVTSPTFSLVNEYLTENNEIIYHFDFYRVESTEEVFDFGYEDYFFSGNLCLIEWPELIERLLPENNVKIIIEEIENNIRHISCDRVIN